MADGIGPLFFRTVKGFCVILGRLIHDIALPTPIELCDAN